MMRFGQYFKHRRRQLHLTQGDFVGYSQAYISNIERGINNPTQRDTIADLARILQLSPDNVDWLWMFSLLDHDPRLCLSAPNDNGVKHIVVEMNNHYTANASSKEITSGSTTGEVLQILGEPDDNIRFNNREKWIYESKAIHINFINGKVEDVIFK